jgi:glutaredoxin
MARVIVYSQPHCPACNAQKAWFRSEQVAFEDRDVTARQEWLEELVGLGSQGTPTTIVESGGAREVVIGFDRGRLRTLLRDAARGA